MAKPYARPGSREFAWWWAQKRRRAKAPSGTKQIEYLTADGEVFKTADGQTLAVRDAS